MPEKKTNLWHRSIFCAGEKKNKGSLNNSNFRFSGAKLWRRNTTRSFGNKDHILVDSFQMLDCEIERVERVLNAPPVSRLIRDRWVKKQRTEPEEGKIKQEKNKKTKAKHQVTQWKRSLFVFIPSLKNAWVHCAPRQQPLTCAFHARLTPGRRRRRREGVWMHWEVVTHHAAIGRLGLSSSPVIRSVWACVRVCVCVSPCRKTEPQRAPASGGHTPLCANYADTRLAQASAELPELPRLPRLPPQLPRLQLSRLQAPGGQMDF